MGADHSKNDALEECLHSYDALLQCVAKNTYYRECLNEKSIFSACLQKSKAFKRNSSRMLDIEKSMDKKDQLIDENPAIMSSPEKQCFPSKDLVDLCTNRGLYQSETHNSICQRSYLALMECKLSESSSDPAKLTRFRDCVESLDPKLKPVKFNSDLTSCMLRSKWNPKENK
jgi:hypothetical protein